MGNFGGGIRKARRVGTNPMFTTMATKTRKIIAKRRADGKLDLRTKKGKEVAERLAKARAAKKKTAKKKRFFFW
jgi:hypothetical protein